MKKRTCPRELVQQEQPVCLEPGEVEVQGACGDGLQRNEVGMNSGPDEPFCEEKALSQCRGMLFCYFSISQAAEMLYLCRKKKSSREQLSHKQGQDSVTGAFSK